MRKKDMDQEKIIKASVHERLIIDNWLELEYGKKDSIFYTKVYF